MARFEFGAGGGTSLRAEQGLGHGSAQNIDDVKSRLERLSSVLEAIYSKYQSAGNIITDEIIGLVEQRFGLGDGRILNAKSHSIYELGDIFSKIRQEELSFISNLKDTDISENDRQGFTDSVKNDFPDQITVAYLQSKDTNQSNIDSGNDSPLKEYFKSSISSSTNKYLKIAKELGKNVSMGFVVAAAVPYAVNALAHIAPFFNGGAGNILNFAGVSYGMFLMVKGVYNAFRILSETKPLKQKQNGFQEAFVKHIRGIQAKNEAKQAAETAEQQTDDTESE